MAEPHITENSQTETVMTFWDHLDVLRSVLWRSVVAVVALSVLIFCLKEEIFEWVLAPCHADFFTYRWLDALSSRMGNPASFSHFDLQLISTDLSAQFQSHLQISVELGVLLAFPYVLWQLFGFISPALYDRERRFGLILLPGSFLLFIIGILANYYILFPVALHFLGSYQVNESVKNIITLSSYMGSFTSMTLTMGLVFELPAVIWLMHRMGLITAQWLRKYQRHALVVIMLLAAFVTPPDIFTMLLVTLPLFLLYEISIWIIK